MRILVTGSADGLGRLAGASLASAGHEVVLHVRNTSRIQVVGDLLDAGASVVVGDLSVRAGMDAVAEQVLALGGMDAVIHNAGVYSGAAVMPVNVVAPYVLVAALPRPDRLVFLSSGMHRGGRPEVDGVDWSGRRRGSYSDSKLFVATLSAAIARRWPDVLSNSVDPGWVPTRMGGPSAPDDLGLGHLTQEWLATSDDPAARTSGGYWHHQHRVQAHPAVSDERFQEDLIASLAAYTGLALA